MSAAHPLLLDYEAEIRRQTREAQELAAGLADAVLLARPLPDRWSIAEHLEHLAMANAQYLDTIEAALAQARARGLLGAGRSRGTLFGEWFIRSMEPPVRLRIRAPRRIRPPRELDRRVLDDFAAAQERVVGALRSAEGVDFGRATMRSPFFKPLKLSLDQAFRVILAHNRRHLWHVRRMLERPASAR